MELNQAIGALGALAQETRLKAFRLLVCAGESGLAAGEISEQLDIPATTLSFHLKELTRSGLLVSQREGRSIRYWLHVEGMRQFLDYLSEDCCQGRPELCMPQKGRKVSRRIRARA
jgi:DNA-binding transcriptional ArsR family regulator